MKWFKHDTDASDDIKIKRLEEEFRNDGYAVFFKTLEIIGKEGKKCRISFENYPKKWISNRCHVSEEKLSEIYTFMGKLGLICPKSLKKGELRTPTFIKRADDYTKRLRRNSEQVTDNVPLEENRRRKEKNKNICIYFSEIYKKEIGVGYPINYAKDKTIIYDLMEVYDESTLKTLMDEFFVSARDPNEWWADKLSIGVFKSVIPQLIGKLRKKN